MKYNHARPGIIILNMLKGQGHFFILQQGHFHWKILKSMGNLSGPKAKARVRPRPGSGEGHGLHRGMASSMAWPACK